MKKFIVFAMACMLVFSLFIMPASAAGDLEIDIDSLTQGNGVVIHVFSAAGYTENVIQFSGPAGSQDLGAIDLSKYGSVTIEYGSDGGAIFEGDSAQAYLAITENGPVQDGSGAALSDAKIIGKVDLEDQSNGGWATANTEVTIPFNSNYNGNVYVALFAVTKAGVAPNGNFDALAITKITFHEKTGSETPTDPTPSSPEPGSTDPTEPPKTGDVNTIIAIAAAGIVLTVLFQIKRIKI
ncbi:MAG: hypothetical protein KIC77_05525 [Clostridiales bacterium]|jgi:hypothetical protein|nr:hypothetical protein [Clostridiales bacterium]